MANSLTCEARMPELSTVISTVPACTAETVWASLPSTPPGNTLTLSFPPDLAATISANRSAPITAGWPFGFCRPTLNVRSLTSCAAAAPQTQRARVAITALMNTRFMGYLLLFCNCGPERAEECIGPARARASSLPRTRRSMRPGRRFAAAAVRRYWMAQPHQRDQRQEQHRRNVEDVVGRQHEGLLVHHPVDLSQRLVRCQATGGEARQRGLRGRTAWVHRLGQLRMVQGRAVLPQRGGDRGAEGAGGDPREVRQARRGGNAIRRQARQGDRDQRDEEEGHRDALDQRRDHQRGEVGLRVEARAHPQHDG